MSLLPSVRWTLPLSCLLALALATPQAARAQPASRSASMELAAGVYRPEVEGGDFDGIAWSLRGSLAVAPRLGLRFGLSSHDRSRARPRTRLSSPIRRESLLLDVAVERDWTFGRSAVAVSVGPGLRRSVATDAEEFEGTTEERSTRLNLGLRVAGRLDVTERVYLRPELGVRWYGDETDEEAMLALGWRF